MERLCKVKNGGVIEETKKQDRTGHVASVDFLLPLLHLQYQSSVSLPSVPTIGDPALDLDARWMVISRIRCLSALGTL